MKAVAVALNRPAQNITLCLEGQYILYRANFLGQELKQQGYTYVQRLLLNLTIIYQHLQENDEHYKHQMARIIKSKS